MKGFPDGFLWGAATSSHQVEGGNRNNDWWEWERRPGQIYDGSCSGDACAWWSGSHHRDRGRRSGSNPESAPCH
jgi:beta-glucosidase